VELRLRKLARMFVLGSTSPPEPVPRFQSDTPARPPPEDARQSILAAFGKLEGRRCTWMLECSTSQPTQSATPARSRRRKGTPRRAADGYDFGECTRQEPTDPFASMLSIADDDEDCDEEEEGNGNGLVVIWLDPARCQERARQKKRARSPKGGYTAEEVQRVARAKRLKRAAESSGSGLRWRGSTWPCAVPFRI
jgi:hypothetical protein